MKTKYAKSIIFAIILLTLINIATATKPLPPNYGTFDYSKNLIELAEKKVLEAESLLSKAKEKDLSSLSLEDRNFLKEIIKKSNDMLKDSKEKLDSAKKHFGNKQYFDASSNAASSINLADLVVIYANKILEGRIKENWNRVGSIETVYSGIPKIGTSEVSLEIGQTIFLGDVEWIKLTLEDISKTCIEESCGEYAEIHLNVKDRNVTSKIIENGQYNLEGELLIYFLGREENIGKFKVIIQDDKKEEIKKIKTKEKVEIKNDRIYVNNKEIKIMPNTASEKAIETLNLKKEVEIGLKDTGKPIYEIIGKKEAKIFGLFRKEMKVKIQINSDTGEIEKIEKPWWSFLAKT